MRAIVFDQPGDPDVLHIAEVADPVPAPGEVLLRVHAAGVNRADLLQRRGFYPPPPGASEILGMEASGVVEEVTEGVAGWSPGDRACALLAGGGYAEKVSVPAVQLMPVPQALDTVRAGAIPEVFITAHDNLSTRGRLQSGETVLVHGGAGGVGTAAIQVARRIGARVITTAGSAERVGFCRALGADEAINHREEDFVARVAEITGGRGVDVILDIIGAAYLERNLAALARDGRLVVIGLQGGVRAEVDLNTMLSRRLSLIATTLRGRPVEQKGEIVRRAVEDLWSGFDDGSLRPVIDRILPLECAADAHRAMETGEPFGKIVLAVAASARA
ncbi:MAG TPA: NAD(P)H-quinone oxidoreductase [Candidatus Dormibacteraeota bacterium]|jgi:putative PIG3 family NAD(P)H quinone oxidoreductase|nr:NAD(P)H-quinone oxidoreductase [Candidatus Dormibacteraeota bacterium]